MEQQSEAPKKKQKLPPWGPVSSAILTVVAFFFSQFAATLCVLLCAYIAGVGSNGFDIWLQDNNFANFLYTLFAGGFVVLTVAGLLRLTGQTLKNIGLKKPHLTDAAKALIAFAAYIATFLVISILAKLLVPTLDLEQQQQIGFSQTSGVGNLLLIGLSLVIIPPFVEEILVRGFLFTGLRRKLPFWPAAVVSGVIFGIAHLQFGSGAPLLWIAALDTFILALFLAYLRESTKSLAAPIMLHMIKNALAFSLLFVFTS